MDLLGHSLVVQRLVRHCPSLVTFDPCCRVGAGEIYVAQEACGSGWREVRCAFIACVATRFFEMHKRAFVDLHFCRYRCKVGHDEEEFREL